MSGHRGMDASPAHLLIGFSPPVGAKRTETNAVMASRPLLDIGPGQAFAKKVVIGSPPTNAG